MICLSGEYVAEIVIQPFLSLTAIFLSLTSSLQEFSLELTDFIVFNIASYNKSGSSISFTIRIYCVI